MTTPIPLMVELCAGTAALSLRLHRDGAKPPVSRMGAKTGYANVILRILGLAPGQRAAAYLWCEPDPGVRLLLHAYRDAALARAAASIIRRWAAAGATVAISEAEPIPELVAEGWHAVRIDGERVGQKRTFSKQQAEWLTLNRAPAWVPPVQGSLFGGGR